MTEINTCGCSSSARRTKFYRTHLCHLFHRYPLIARDKAWHTPRDRCAECGRRYTVCHVRGLVHPDTGCPYAPTTQLPGSTQSSLTMWTGIPGGYTVWTEELGLRWYGGH